MEIPRRRIRLLEEETTDIILRLFFRVYDRLGYGFLESVYCAALALEFEKEGISFVREGALDVWYEGRMVGHFRADFVVRGRVVVEVKATKLLHDVDQSQLLNCLRASNLEVGLLLHFGPRAAFKRLIHTNDRKPNLPSR
jgi:GxxExxY protein